MNKNEAIDYCINLAKNAIENDIRPNPFVGAMIVNQADQVIGTGFHQKLGGPTCRSVCHRTSTPKNN